MQEPWLSSTLECKKSPAWSEPKRYMGVLTLPAKVAKPLPVGTPQAKYKNESSLLLLLPSSWYSEVCYSWTWRFYMECRLGRNEMHYLYMATLTHYLPPTWTALRRLQFRLQPVPWPDPPTSLLLSPQWNSLYSRRVRGMSRHEGQD